MSPVVVAMRGVLGLVTDTPRNLVEGDEEDCSFLFVNKVDEGDAPVNFRVGCGGEELSLLLLLISYISNDSFPMSSEELSSFLEEAALVKDLKCLVGCLI